MTERALCPQCDFDVRPGSRFCSACGFALTHEADLTRPSEPHRARRDSFVREHETPRASAGSSHEHAQATNVAPAIVDRSSPVHRLELVSPEHKRFRRRALGAWAMMFIVSFAWLIVRTQWAHG